MILIVDDKKENIYSLQSLLQLHSYDVDTALSGEEALKKVLNRQYEIIILDVQMPGIDGYEVAETLTGYSKTKNTPIIFLSAVNIDKKFITKGYAAGGADYLTKPFDPDLLLLKVKTFCRLHAQTQELKMAQESLKAEVHTRILAEKALLEANLQLEEKINDRTRDLLRINKSLEESNTDLQQFASIASHDLQEPLRKIMIFSRMLQEKFLNSQSGGHQYIEKIFSASNRMRNLINDLLEYSKLSDTPQFVLTDLNPILAETLSDLELLIDEKKAKIFVESMPVLEVIPGQMRQVFQNLLSNALKFSGHDQHPVINISCEKTNVISTGMNGMPEEGIRIFIRDNGIGFNEMYLHKIFNIFQRLHQSEYEGNGIGLAIVKKIIDKHHGTLTAISKEGNGATFIIELPLRQFTTYHSANSIPA